MPKTALPRLDNRDARRLFLHRHALAEQPTGSSRGDDLLALIDRLGFVQVDSINTVERAHHMILFARRQSYRPKHLKPLLKRDRSLFEHWTHDASIIPTAFFPHWRLRFERSAKRLNESWHKWRDPGFVDKFDVVLERVRAGGPVTSSDVGEDEARSNGGWCDEALRRGELIEIEIALADGSRPRRTLARPDVFEQAVSAPEPPGRIRILSPFDPALRDRNRAQRLFGFHYRIEVFVPAAKRRYGYYVFPVLEGDRLIGRIDMKREAGVLRVAAFWPEAKVALSKGRLARLETALDRIARFAGCDDVAYAKNWQRAAP